MAAAYIFAAFGRVLGGTSTMSAIQVRSARSWSREGNGILFNCLESWALLLTCRSTSVASSARCGAETVRCQNAISSKEMRLQLFQEHLTNPEEQAARG